MLKKINLLIVIPVIAVMFIITGCGKSEKEANITDKNKSSDSKGTKTVMVNVNESKVSWIGKKVTGQHNGNIKLASGELNLDGDKVVSGKLAIDMNTISISDLKGEDSTKLSGHLKSDDFFSVAKNPTANFEISSVKPLTDQAKPQFNSTVTGNLTIKGITKGISFPASIKVENGVVTANADFEIDRTQWDIKYGSGKFFENLGDKMISDNFGIQFNLNAK